MVNVYVLGLFSLLGCITVTQGIRTYPLYRQCDPRWGNNEMGTNGNGERSTICGEGCAMTSLAMVIAGLGIPSPLNSSYTPVNPSLLNAWLMMNNGYECLDGDCNNLVLSKVSQLNSTIQLIGELSPPSIGTIETGIDSGLIAFLAHVQNRSHFVVLTDYVGTGTGNFTVNDPYYNLTNYQYDDISDIIMYALLT